MKILVVAGQRSNKVVTPLQRSGADVVTVDIRKNSGLVGKYASLIMAVRQQIVNENPDAILTKGSSLGFVSLLVAAPYRIPVLPRVAGDIIRQQKNNFWESIRAGQFVSAAMFPLIVLMHWLVVRSAPGVIVVSEHIAERLRSYPGMSGVQCAVVPVSIDMTPFLVDHETEQSMTLTADRTILTVTNLDFKGKYVGIKGVLPTIYNVLNNRENCEYVIAGSGQYKNRLKSYVENTVPNDDVRERIRFLGYVEDVHRLYHHADLFLYISYEDGYPNVILEAMAAGLPIVANPGVGINEQISNDKTGILVDPQRGGDIQAAIEGVFEDPIYYSRLGERAHETVRDRNSHESVGKKTVEGLTEVLSSVNK